jgi:elongation factor 1-beta
MSQLLVRTKVLRKEADINLGEIENQIKANLPQGMSVRSTREEPIAFGLNALMLDFLIEEKEGATDELENAVRKSDLISDLQVLGVSRMSTKLR